MQFTRTVSPCRPRPGWLRRWGAALLLLVMGVQVAAVAQTHLPAAGVQDGPIRFGILPLGGVFESRNDWEPLLADLARVLNRPVSVLSVTSYDALDQAIKRNQVDMAFLSGRMALDAVTLRGMTVVAQVTRHDGLPGYRSLLLLRKGGGVTTLEDVLSQPERWRLARGEAKSVSGFIVPQLQLFMPAGIAMETRFKSEFVGTHQATALAVANGEADVATNNTADFERFKLQFPVESERLIIVWQSDLIERPPCPACGERMLRPDVVWFGEMPYDLERIEQAILVCDIFVSIGTSGAVYPAAGYAALAAACGARTVELNLEPSEALVPFDEVRAGPASRVVPGWVEERLAIHGP